MVEIPRFIQACGQERNAVASQLFLSSSRACLGKLIVFSIEMAPSGRFPIRTCCQRRAAFAEALAECCAADLGDGAVQRGQVRSLNHTHYT
jgi:hypothetical protein